MQLSSAWLRCCRFQGEYCGEPFAPAFPKSVAFATTLIPNSPRMIDSLIMTENKTDNDCDKSRLDSFVNYQEKSLVIIFSTHPAALFEVSLRRSFYFQNGEIIPSLPVCNSLTQKVVTTGPRIAYWYCWRWDRWSCCSYCICLCWCEGDNS